MFGGAHVWFRSRLICRRQYRYGSTTFPLKIFSWVPLSVQPQSVPASSLTAPTTRFSLSCYVFSVSIGITVPVASLCWRRPVIHCAKVYTGSLLIFYNLGRPLPETAAPWRRFQGSPLPTYVSICSLSLSPALLFSLLCFFPLSMPT